MISLQAALTELHNRHYKNVVEYFRGKTRDLEQAKELTQIVFFKLCNCKEIEKFNVKYLYGIAKNVLNDHWKKQFKLPLVDCSEDELKFIAADYSTGIESKFENEKRLKKAFEELSSHLTTKQSMIFLLKYQKRKSIQEIMLRLDLSEVVIKKRLWNSRKRLKHIYGDQQWTEIWSALSFRSTKKIQM